MKTSQSPPSAFSDHPSIDYLSKYSLSHWEIFELELASLSSS